MDMVDTSFQSANQNVGFVKSGTGNVCIAAVVGANTNNLPGFGLLTCMST